MNTLESAGHHLKGSRTDVSNQSLITRRHGRITLQVTLLLHFCCTLKNAETVANRLFLNLLHCCTSKSPCRGEKTFRSPSPVKEIAGRLNPESRKANGARTNLHKFLNNTQPANS